MLLWTIQNEEVYKTLQHNGVYTTNENYLFCQNTPCLQLAYDWFSHRLTEKIGGPPLGVNYPIWAWHTWEGQRERLDFRLFKYAKKGTRMVEMELEIPDEQIVLSNFDLWNAALNMSNLNLTSDEEFELFHKNLERFGYRSSQDLFFTKEKEKVILTEPELISIKDKIMQSWEKCFDLDSTNKYYTGSLKSIQATFWALSLEQVKGVWHFKCS